MLVQVTTLIKDRKGDQVYNAKIDPNDPEGRRMIQDKDSPMTVRDLLLSSIDQRMDEDNIPGTSFELHKIGMEIFSQEEVEMTVAMANRLQARVSKIAGPLLLGRVMEVMQEK